MKDTYQDLFVFHLSDFIGSNLKHPKKVLIFGNFGAYNLGDEAILSGEIADLKNRAEVTVVSRFPELTKKMHDVKAVSLFDVAGIIQSVCLSNVVILGGGGLFCKSTTKLGVAFQVYFMTLLMALPLLLRKKIIAYGIGIYPNMNPQLLTLAIKLLQKAEIVTVRDEASLQLLKRAHCQAQLCKDNSYLMPMINKVAMQNIPFFAQRLKKTKLNIALALKKPSSSADANWLSQQIVKFMNTYRKHCAFWFFALDTHPSYKNDADFAQELVKEVQQKTSYTLEVHFVPTTFSPQLTFSAFSLMDYVIAMRLHSMIFAHRLGTPFFGICYDKKCSSFMESIGRKAVWIDAVRAFMLTKDLQKI